MLEYTAASGRLDHATFRARADASWCSEHFKQVVRHFNKSYSALCKVVRPNYLVRSKKRMKVSLTDLITISRCFLSFKTVVKS